MTEHDRERLETLAALVGSGAATPQEQRELDAFLDAHPDAKQQAKAFADAGALLADGLADVAPPANALAGIRSAVAKATDADDSPQHAGAQIISIAERRKKLYMATTLVAAAAAVAFAVLWNSERQQARDAASAMQSRIEKLEVEYGELVGAHAEATQQLAAMRQRMGVPDSPHLRLASIATAEADAHAKILIDPDGGRWLVVAHALPDIPSDKDYQMWIVPKGSQTPVPMGLFKPGPTGQLEVMLDLPPDMEPAAAAISLERAGGVQVPTDVRMIGPI